VTRCPTRGTEINIEVSFAIHELCPDILRETRVMPRHLSREIQIMSGHVLRDMSYAQVSFARHTSYVQLSSMRHMSYIRYYSRGTVRLRTKGHGVCFVFLSFARYTIYAQISFKKIELFSASRTARPIFLYLFRLSLFGQEYKLLNIQLWMFSRLMLYPVPQFCNLLSTYLWNNQSVQI
jgi:hypothetical protein